MPKPLVQSTGRRKQAVARVRIRAGSGQVTVNKRPLESYFPSETHRMIVTEPLRLTTTADVYDVDALLHDARGEGLLHPRAGLARVAPDDEARAAEDPRGRAAEGARHVCRELGAGDTSEPVGTEPHAEAGVRASASASSTAEPCGPSSGRTSSTPSHGRHA